MSGEDLQLYLPFKQLGCQTEFLPESNGGDAPECFMPFDIINNHTILGNAPGK